MPYYCRFFFFTFILFHPMSAISQRDHAPSYGPRTERSTTNKALEKIGFDREDYTHHEYAAEAFKDKYFRNDETHEVSLIKTRQFFDNFVHEFEVNKRKIQETEFIERLDVKKSHVKKAEQKMVTAHENNQLLDVYDLYLFPKLNEMITSLEEHQDNEVIEGLLDDFIRGYVPYYNPNPWNNIYKTKINLMGGLYRIVRFPQYKKLTKKIEANNLLIETAEQRDKINGILSHQKNIGQFLDNDEVTALVANGFDISTLNPGKSALWRPQSAEKKAQMYDRDPDLFPGNEVKKTFDEVMLGGANSDKIRLVYKDKNNIRHDVKLKIGDEVHLELASSALMQMLGFSTDKMYYTGDVTFYLKHKTFENFEAEVRQKFGQHNNVRYNYERGISATGEKFITWRDTLMEARFDNEMRIAPVDLASWDLRNRREYRGLNLVIAWLALNDLKPDNTKALLVKRDNAWEPDHRIHDLGVSLGPPIIFTGIDSVLSLPAGFGKVNQFETKMVKKTKDGVKVIWNDFCYQHRFYNSSTYNDLKWMARKIAALSKRDIKNAFKHSGMHPDVAHLYTIKMIMRRNNIVKSFELDDEFQIYPVPHLKKYSPEKYSSIKKGEINFTALSDKNNVPIRVRTWGSLISMLMAGQSVPYAKFSQDLKNAGNVSGQVQGGGVYIAHNWPAPFNFGPFSAPTLTPGLTFIPSRTVIESPQLLKTQKLDRHGKLKLDKDGNAIPCNRPYMVIDQVKIVVGIGAGISNSQIFPLNLHAGIKFVEKTIIHRHFTETVKDAWLSPFRLPQWLIIGGNKFAAQQLRDLENIESYFSFGLDVNLGAETSLINTGTALGGSVRSFKRKLLYRDQFGKLHYLSDHLDRKNVYGGAYISRVDLTQFSLALLDLSFNKDAYRGEIKDYIVGVRDNLATETHDHEAKTKERQAHEIEGLKNLKKGINDFVIPNFERTYSGASSNKNLALGFVFAQTRWDMWGQIEDTFSDGQVRKLFLGNRFTGKHVGKKDVVKYEEVTDIAVIDGNSKQTIVEVDMQEPESFILTVKTKVYTRKTNRKGLLKIIKKLNARYTDNPMADEDQQFFSLIELPDKDEQNEYRKIYADIKTQVDGQYLLQQIKDLNVADVEELVDQFYKNEALDIKKVRINFNDDGKAYKKDPESRVKSHLANTMDYLNRKKKIISHFKELKYLVNNTKDDIAWKKIWITSRDLVHELFSRYHGVHLLKNFLNKNRTPDYINKGFIVYGEIRNILDHIATLERPHGHYANLRSAGKHWGEFKYGKDQLRKVQYFLKYEDPTNQVPIYAPLLVNSPKLLGRLENGQPPNFNGEGI